MYFFFFRGISGFPSPLNFVWKSSTIVGSSLLAKGRLTLFFIHKGASALHYYYVNCHSIKMITKLRPCTILNWICTNKNHPFYFYMTTLFMMNDGIKFDSIHFPRLSNLSGLVVETEKGVPSHDWNELHVSNLHSFKSLLPNSIW